LDYRNGYADVSFGQMHYSVRHDPSAASGSALVLLNPRARSSLPLLPLFKGFERVISIDLPGFGRSSHVPNAPAMREIVDGMVECLDALQIGRADLFGLHTGHKIAAGLASERPQRVGRLVIAGRSHSLIPDHKRRNLAMQAVIDENQPDMAIIRMEGRYVDEAWAPRAFAEIFKANFEFDFAAAMRNIVAPTLVVEIASEREDELYGRQGHKLIAGMRDARCIVLPQIDPTGLSFYTGTETMARTVMEFLDSTATPATPPP
jgi:pimeloyl-ACP methyl ester carboxylesterase